MTLEKYEWAVVGGGISGISIAEILCREGHSTILIEKNERLASETSKVFHEWLHSGALYSLVPDNLLTLRYLLGATDDLFEFYGSFSRMNLAPSESGVNLVNTGWFNDENIEFRYKIHKYNPIWMSLVSRSINIINLVSDHDWLRRRAGSQDGFSKLKLNNWFNKLSDQIYCKEKFLRIDSPDITMNSRVLLSDLIETSQKNGLKISSGETVTSIIEEKNDVSLQTSNKMIKAKNIVICAPDFLSKFYNLPLKFGYAPMAIVSNVPEKEKSFVELDYNTRKCINLLKKNNGVGQIGGITLSKKSQIEDYSDYLIEEHKKRNPEIKLLGTYVGIKKELVNKKQKRNYLFHINKSSKKIWSVVLGKFSLAFSMAPEFYRRVYKRNPIKNFKTIEGGENNKLISPTSWEELAKRKK